MFARRFIGGRQTCSKPRSFAPETARHLMAAAQVSRGFRCVRTVILIAARCLLDYIKPKPNAARAGPIMATGIAFELLPVSYGQLKLSHIFPFFTPPFVFILFS